MASSKDTRSIAAGVGKVSFENLAAGTYSVSVNYAPVADRRIAATVIDNLNVTEENVKIAISGRNAGRKQAHCQRHGEAERAR